MNIVYLVALTACCSANLFSVNPDFTISYEVSSNELAHVYYDQRLFEDGMNYINIYANQDKTLLEQHRGAGFL